MLRQYKSKSQPIVAVQMNLDTAGISYAKWGGSQHGKAGDWIVDNGGECYTIDAESFALTYTPVDGVPGNYVKTATVWAETAETDGDMLVYNGEHRADGYAMSAESSAERYQPAD